MKEVIEKNKEITSNSKQIEILKKNFPNCFDKEGKFIPSKLEDLVKDEVDIVNESYSLNWLGKSYARLLANQEVTTMLEEDKEHNEKEENKNSNNIYIEGDNLEVLKHMVNAYSEKIKMIYIDPPYNTGTDFIYQDDRKFTKEELSKLANVDEEEAKRILDFTNSKSNSHSAWLTFMYPRLYIARELLKEDGVIFISIDDNEQAQLKILCDEVFGEENFVSDFIWEKTYSPKNNNKYVSGNHESILCYGKVLSSIEKFNRLPRTEKSDSFYNKNDNDGKGAYGLDNLTIGGQKGYDIKWNGLTFRESPTSGWRFSESKMYELIKEGRIYIPDDESKRPRYKRYLSEVDGIISKTILPYSEVSHTDASKKYLNNLIGNNIFDYPKPLELIKRFLILTTNKDDIILDFFSGSATTAHAVMDLNANDNGNRKFIMVNLSEIIDEKTNKNAYDFCVNELKEEPVITTIGKERIRRAAKKIKEDNQDKDYINDIDLGFKVYKSIDMVKTNYLKELERLDTNSSIGIFNDNLSDKDIQNLLLTWKIYDGAEFNDELEIIKFGDYESYKINNKLYLMNRDFDNNKIKMLLEKIDKDVNFDIRKIVVFSIHFSSKQLMELEEAIKGYKNKKNIELEIEKRY